LSVYKRPDAIATPAKPAKVPSTMALRDESRASDPDVVVFESDAVFVDPVVAPVLVAEVVLCAVVGVVEADVLLLAEDLEAAVFEEEDADGEEVELSVPLVPLELTAPVEEVVPLEAVSAVVEPELPPVALLPIKVQLKRKKKRMA
jgi:hypothetical protein